MKLFMFPVAPNPTKVRLYLAEKKLAGVDLGVEQVMVDFREKQQKSPEHLARNPQGKLPVLAVEDGVYLTESLPIILFLEELHPDPPMIGCTSLERAQTLSVERLAEQGVLYCMARIVHATSSPLGLPPNPQVAEHFRAALPEALQLLDDRLSDGRPFLMGDRPTVADCTLEAGLQFGRMGKIALDPSYEHLSRWNEAFRTRPSSKEVLVL